MPDRAVPFAMRALLCLKQQVAGSNNTELLPLLKKLSEFYREREELNIAAALLDWHLEIATNHGLEQSDEARELLALLIKMLFSLNRTAQAEKYVDIALATKKDK